MLGRNETRFQFATITEVDGKRDPDGRIEQYTDLSIRYTVCLKHGPDYVYVVVHRVSPFSMFRV
jgi:hypothetical protein